MLFYIFFKITCQLQQMGFCSSRQTLLLISIDAVRDRSCRKLFLSILCCLQLHAIFSMSCAKAQKTIHFQLAAKSLLQNVPDV